MNLDEVQDFTNLENTEINYVKEIPKTCMITCCLGESVIGFVTII